MINLQAMEKTEDDELLDILNGYNSDEEDSEDDIIQYHRGCSNDC